jgi:hypothetical protein
VSTTATPIADADVERPPKEVLAVPAAADAAARSPAQATTSRGAALDNLRAFVTVLVVTVHSVAAYALSIPPAAFLARWRPDRR